MNEELSKKRLLVSILIVFLSVLTFSIYFYYFSPYRTFLTPKNDNTESVSLPNSYIFASPVRAKANSDLIRVTVILLDKNGRGIKNQLLKLNINDKRIAIIPVQNKTDESGRAIFDVSSKAVGSFKIEASTSDTSLDNIVNVVFD